MRININNKNEAIKVCNASLEAAKESQDSLNAVVTFVEDIDSQFDGVSEDAKLFGVPYAAKDNFSTKGIRTTASSKILDNFIPVYDATVIEKLKAAGAVVVTKTSMDELGMGGTNLNAYTGICHNPWDVNRISGGSSGGSAALVASGIVPFALGSDTGDSVRKPAAYTGIVGVKPTYGRISRYGVVPYASSLDHVGYFTTSINDAATLLEVIAGRDNHDMTSSWKEVEAYSANLNADIAGKNIAVLKPVYDDIKDEEIKAQFDSLLNKLKDAGANIEFVSMDGKLLRAVATTYYIIANAEASANHSNLDGIRFGERVDGETLEEIMMNSRTEGLGLSVRKRSVVGSYALFTENQEKIFRKAQRVRRVIVNAYTALFNDFDAVLTPAAPTVAPTIEEAKVMITNDEIAENHMTINNLCGNPALTQCIGFVEGMPISVQVSTKAFDEQTMFNIASAIEAMCDMEGNCMEVVR